MLHGMPFLSGPRNQSIPIPVFPDSTNSGEQTNAAHARSDILCSGCNVPRQGKQGRMSNSPGGPCEHGNLNLCIARRVQVMGFAPARDQYDISRAYPPHQDATTAHEICTSHEPQYRCDRHPPSRAMQVSGGLEFSCLPMTPCTNTEPNRTLKKYMTPSK